MTKITLSLVAALMASGVASARTLSPNEAVARALADSDAPASTFTGLKAVRKVTAALTLSTPSGSPALYVINNAGADGFLVVAADDVAAPILGWADKGDFDSANMAPGLRYWLEALQDQIAWAEENGLDVFDAPASDYYPTIAPKMTTEWDQGYPYNDLCPLVGTRRTYTGCVATAMAQMLKARSFPTKGVGTHSYTWNGQTLSYDYAGTTFEWNLMLDTYGADATAAQRNAVAELMLACGIGVNMGYGTNASGAASPAVGRALIDNFGYDPAMEFIGRPFYTSKQWEKLIYDELAANGPVYMSGRNDEGGHAFIADGYNKGFLHMNWGWSGLSNGYYRINALDPDSQGTGGSSAGYNVDQCILIGVKPAVEGSEPSAPNIVSYSPISASVNASYLTVTGPFYSYTPREITGRMGIQLYDAETGEEGQLLRTSQLRMTPGTGLNQIQVSVSLLRKGHWRGVPVYTEGSGSNQKIWPIKMQLCQAGYIDLVATDEGNTVSVPENGVFTPGKLDFVSPVYTNKTFSVNLAYTSTATDNYTRQIVAVLLDPTSLAEVSRGGIQNTIFEPGANTLTYTSDWQSTPAAGSYKFVLRDATGFDLSDTYDVELTRGSATYVANVSEWSIANADNVDINNISFDVTVNVTYGYMASPLVARIYSADGTGNPIGTISSPLVFGTKGDKVETTFSGPFLQGEPNTTYSVYIYDSRGQRLSSVAKTMTTGATTAIDTITANVLGDANDVNLQGQPVANPTPGALYIVRTLSGKVSKIVK